MTGNPEKERLDQANTGGQPWKKWGPYLSERQWGTATFPTYSSADAKDERLSRSAVAHNFRLHRYDQFRPTDGIAGEFSLA